MKKFALLASVLVGASGVWAITNQLPLAWDPPTTNTDGTSLTDLAGYRVYTAAVTRSYGLNADVGLSTQAVVQTTRTGTWFFAVTAYNVYSNESAFSAELCWTNTPAAPTPPIHVRKK